MTVRARATRNGYLLLIAAMSLWSTAEVVTRIVQVHVAPIQFAWLRFTLGAVLLTGFLPSELRRRSLCVDRRILLHAAWMAFFGIVVNSIAYQYALRHAGAGVVATVFGASPLTVFICSRIFLGDPMTWPRFLGVVLGFVGIVILGASKPSETFSLVGLACALTTVTSFALFTVFVKKYAGEFGGLPITVFAFWFGSLWMFPLVLWEGETAIFHHLSEAALPMLYLGFGSTGVAYLCYFIGLDRVDATSAISLVLLKPPLATALAALVLGEAITWNLGAALIFIVGGLYLVNIVNRWRVRATAGVSP